MKKITQIVSTMEQYKRTDEIKNSLTVTVDGETDSIVIPEQKVDEELIRILEVPEPERRITVMNFERFVNEKYSGSHVDDNDDENYEELEEE